MYRILQVSLIICALVTFSACSQKAHNNEADNLLDVQHQRYALSTLKQQWLIVNYWATWCGPCREEIPELNALARSNPQWQFFAVNFDNLNRNDLIKEANALGIQFPVLLTTPSVLNIPQPQVLPVTVILAPGLEIYKTLTGPQTQASILSAMAEGL